jgi:hypothetical protein
MSKRKTMKSVANGLRVLALACAVVIALVTIVGKGSSSGPTVKAVALDPATASGPIPVNVDFQVKAIATLSNGSTQDVTSSSQWTSSDPATVSVSAAGKIRGLQSGGPVNITAKVNGIASSPLSVTVNADPNYKITALTIAPFNQAVLPVGDTRTHNARATYSDGTNTGDFDVSEDVIWFSDNEAVVTVDKGVATGRGKGNTEIGARLESPAVNSNKLPIYVDLTTAQATLQVAPIQQDDLLQSFTFQATAIKKDQNGSSVDVTKTSAWSSSNGSVLTVSNADGSQGFVTANSPGTATIIANFGSLTGTQKYTVSDFPLKNVRVLVREELPVGVTADVRVTAETDQAGETIDISDYVILSVFDPQVASVSNEGPDKSTVTGIKAGSTSIRASLAGSSEPLASRNTTFSDGTLNSLTLIPQSPEPLPQGAKQRIRSNGTFTLDSGSTTFDVTRQVTFKTSASSVAEISNAPENKGEVHGLSVGTANLSAEYASVKSNAVQQQVTAGGLVSTAIKPADSTFALSAGILQFMAEGTYANGDKRDVTQEATWLSSDNAIATFSSGPVKGRLFAFNTTNPTVTIRAIVPGAAETANGSTSLTITGPRATSVKISGGNTVQQGQELALSAIATFDDMSSQDVTLAADWSSNSSVATVIKGVVRGISAGSANITASLPGSVLDTVPVTIVAAPGGQTSTLYLSVEVGGFVTTNPNVGQCNSGADCQVELPVGSVITLTATPNPGNKFEEWDGSGGCDQKTETPTGGTCTRTMQIGGGNFIQAEFDPL